jgi:hypothetical protein
MQLDVNPKLHTSEFPNAGFDLVCGRRNVFKVRT